MKANIFENCTCQQVNMAKNMQVNTPTSIIAAVDSNWKKRQKTVLIHGEYIKLCISSQRGEFFQNFDVFFSII